MQQDSSALTSPDAAAIIRAGTAPAFLVAGQVVHVIAGTRETDGAFGLVLCESPRDRFPIPLHWHEREHDTWLCTRGQLQVWGNGQGRVLHPGDFAYVPPGEVHAYQCTGTQNAFFGLVAPGGWEAFFGDAGTPWDKPSVPPAGSQPFDVQRMIAAQRKHAIMRVEQPYPDITDAADDALPGRPQAYVLKAGHGNRRAFGQALFTTLIGTAESGGLFSMHTVEAPRGASLSTHRLTEGFCALHVLSGAMTVGLNGIDHVMTEGDTACIPAGTARNWAVTSHAARFVLCTSGGAMAGFVDTAGDAIQGFASPNENAPPDPQRLRAVGDKLGVHFM